MISDPLHEIFYFTFYLCADSDVGEEHVAPARPRQRVPDAALGDGIRNRALVNRNARARMRATRMFYMFLKFTKNQYRINLISDLGC